jgi:hypothetical protein
VFQISENIRTEPAQKARIDILSKWDLSDVETRVKARMDWSDDFAREVLDEYRKFMALIVLDPRKTYGMAETVDEVWHQHLLSTRDYLSMCNAIVGGMIHHEQTAVAQGPSPTMAKIREETLRDLSSKFGGPLNAVWSKDAHSVAKCCNSCSHESR